MATAQRIIFSVCSLNILFSSMWQKHIMPQNQIIMSGCGNSTVYYFDSMCKNMLFYQYMAIEFYCYNMWQKHTIFSGWGNSTLFCQYAAKAYYFVSMSEKHIILSVCGKSIVYYFVSICKKYIILSVRGNSIVFCSCMWLQQQLVLTRCYY
jgi:hypothetical protein